MEYASPWLVGFFAASILIAAVRNARDKGLSHKVTWQLGLAGGALGLGALGLWLGT